MIYIFYVVFIDIESKISGNWLIFLRSSTQAIENLINGHAISEDYSFLIQNATEDFLAVRQSGNPISAQGLVGMFASKDLVAESSELIKTHKIEIYGEIAYAVFTLNEIFSYKGNQNIDLSTYTCIFKNENGTWKYAWMQRSQGTTDMKTWE